MKLCQRKMKKCCTTDVFQMTRTSNFSTSFWDFWACERGVKKHWDLWNPECRWGQARPHLVPSLATVHMGASDPSFFPELRGPSLTPCRTVSHPPALAAWSQSLFWQHSYIQGNISDIKLNVSLWAKLALRNFKNMAQMPLFHNLLRSRLKPQTRTHGHRVLYSLPHGSHSAVPAGQGRGGGAPLSFWPAELCPWPVSSRI